MDRLRITYRVLPRGNANVNPTTNMMIVGANTYYHVIDDEGDFIVCNGEEISLNQSLAIRAHVRYVSKVILCMHNGMAIFIALVNRNTLIPFTISESTITPWQAVVYDIPIDNITYYDKLYVSTMSVDMRHVHHTYKIGDSRLVRGDSLSIPNMETMYYVDSDIMVLSNDNMMYVYSRHTQQTTRINKYAPLACAFSHENNILKFIYYSHRFDQYRRYTVRL